MFFMMGITSGRKDLTYNQMMICSHCGQYGRYTVYMTYTVLSLFFIPCFKWNRQYCVTASCCKTTWRLDREVGRRIARGEDVEIRPEDLELVSTGGWNDQAWKLPVVKRCSDCGYTTEEDFDYCPKCGKKL